MSNETVVDALTWINRIWTKEYRFHEIGIGEAIQWKQVLISGNEWVWKIKEHHINSTLRNYKTALELLWCYDINILRISYEDHRTIKEFFAEQYHMRMNQVYKMINIDPQMYGNYNIEMINIEESINTGDWQPTPEQVNTLLKSLGYIDRVRRIKFKRIKGWIAEYQTKNNDQKSNNGNNKYNNNAKQNSITFSNLLKDQTDQKSNNDNNKYNNNIKKKHKKDKKKKKKKNL